jgi:hypothetical protein
MNLTPWKKSRTFGDIHGGRRRRRMTDNIFKRLHSLSRPGPHDQLPFLIEENPSRDYFFPISAAEALEILSSHSNKDLGGITHIWLRRDKRPNTLSSEHPLAEFICGSGVRVIVLYPWPKNLLLPLGGSKPIAKVLRPFQQLGAEIIQSENHWYAKLTGPNVRQYYAQHLLLHEFAHHIDWFNRYWSKANAKQTEDFANQYAVRWGSTTTEILNNLDSSQPT